MKTAHKNETMHAKRYSRTFVAMVLTAVWLLFAGSFPAGLTGSQAWADEGSASSGSAFCLHVSSFADDQRAQHEVRRLKDLGYPCLYRAEDVSAKTWFRVYLTGFDSMLEARRTGKTLRSGGRITYYHAVKLSLPAALADKSVVAGSEKEPAASQRDQYGANIRFTPHAGPVLVMPGKNDDTAVMQGTAGMHTSEYVPKKEFTAPRPEPATVRGGQYAANTGSAPAKEQVMEMPEHPKETAVFERANDAPPSKNVLKLVKSDGVYKTRKTKNIQPSYPFSFSLRTGAYFLLDAEDFELEGIHDYDDVVWDVSDDMLPMIAAVAEYHPTYYLSIEGSVEKMFSDQLDIMFLSLDPKYSVRLSNGVSAYITCGVAYGKLCWDKVPGDFDCGIGLNAGAGIMASLFTPHLTLGCDLRYRSIEFDYEMPHEDDIVDEPDEALNLSGFSVTGNLSYHF